MIIFQKFVQYIMPWLYNHGIKIAVIIIAAYLIRRFARIFIEKIIRKIIISDHFLDKEAERKREDTLIRIFTVSLGILAWLMALLMILQEAGIAIGPLLAAAGIAGLAFGFGGQYLIRDLISGIFIIVENQYRIGDVVCFDGTCGLVEDISMRMTTLRDLDGTVHHVPHGEIKRVSNLSKQFARVNLNIGISYGSNLEKVILVVNKVGRELAEDSEWKEHILKPPQFLRVDDFGDSAIIIKILGETKPLKQWDVTGELRKRLKIAFDREGIEIPFPQRVIHSASYPSEASQK
ncbi:MAG: mechanosensitive ion channel family protein [Pseudorhodobacter sp.]|nr:mechanosensitive ion channel family protein [Pseudorhodobacter sp.]